EQGVGERVLIVEHRLRARFADDDDVRMIEHVLLGEIAPGDQRNAHSAEPARHDSVRRRAFSLGHWRHVAFRPRIESQAWSAKKWKTAAQIHILESRSRAQRHL